MKKIELRKLTILRILAVICLLVWAVTSIMGLVNSYTLGKKVISYRMSFEVFIGQVTNITVSSLVLIGSLFLVKPGLRFLQGAALAILFTQLCQLIPRIYSYFILIATTGIHLYSISLLAWYLSMTLVLNLVIFDLQRTWKRRKKMSLATIPDKVSPEG